jgi:hypothetical protein
MQVFSIYPKTGGYLISDGTVENSLYAIDRAALEMLYAQLGAFLTDDKQGIVLSPEHDFISTTEARAIAATEGYRLTSSALGGACERGTIAGAVKEHGALKSHWRIPRQSFMDWYRRWKLQKDRGSRRGHNQYYERKTDDVES